MASDDEDVAGEGDNDEPVENGEDGKLALGQFDQQGQQYGFTVD